MTEIERIQDQLKRAFEANAWHGPSVSEVLNGITADQAHARPLRNAHSIWELVRHIAVWGRRGPSSFVRRSRADRDLFAGRLAAAGRHERSSLGKSYGSAQSRTPGVARSDCPHSR